MWKFKTTVIPVVVGALGVLSKDFETAVELIPGNICAKEVQKIALMGTAHILRKILSIK